MRQFIRGNWSQIKSRLRSKYAQLEEQDLQYQDGHEDELLRTLQLKLNMSYTEVMSELRRIITKYK